MDDTEREVEGLMSLPNEVLSQNYIYVDDSDIPILQQTCPALRSVIMTRQFWYNRIHRLCEERVVSPPEEELEEYSIAQLDLCISYFRISLRDPSAYIRVYDADSEPVCNSATAYYTLLPSLPTNLYQKDGIQASTIGSMAGL